MSTYQGVVSKGSRRCYHPMRSYRQTAALERLSQRALRSPKEQLAKLDVSLGINQGASKERKRLHQQISFASPQPKEQVKEVEQQSSPSDSTPDLPVEKKTSKKGKKNKS